MMYSFSKCNTAYATDSEYLLHYNDKHKAEEKGKGKAEEIK